MSAIGSRIRTRRRELDWTLDDLAQRTRMSKGFLSDLETGKRNVGAQNLFSIAQALGVSLDFLMRGGSRKLDEAALQVPASLVRFAQSAELSFSDTMTLLEMRLRIVGHRSDEKSDDLEAFDWARFYNAVKPFLDERASE